MESEIRLFKSQILWHYIQNANTITYLIVYTMHAGARCNKFYSDVKKRIQISPHRGVFFYFIQNPRMNARSFNERPGKTELFFSTCMTIIYKTDGELAAIASPSKQLLVIRVYLRRYTDLPI